MFTLPMAHITIPAETARIRYTAAAGQTVFTIPFPFFEDGDFDVAINGTDTTAWAWAGVAVDGGYQGGTLTLGGAASAGDIITITRSITPYRVTDYPYPSSTLNIETLNTELDRLYAIAQDTRRVADQAFRVPDNEAPPAPVPALSMRAGGLAVFDADGNLTVTPMWTGDANGSFLSSVGGAIGRTVADKLSDTVSITDFMSAAERASRDITNALIRQNALAGDGVAIFIPAGDWTFTQPITFTRQRMALVGAGFQSTRLYYMGSATGVDLFTFGDGTNQLNGLTIGSFFLSSNTEMTDGVAMKFNKVARSYIDLISIDDQDTNATGKLWDAIWFNGIDNCYLTRFMLGNNGRLHGTALRVNGLVAGWKADLFVSHGKITGWDKGIHIAGAFGGFFADFIDDIGNNTNVLIDESWVSEQNREMNFGANFAADSAYIDNMVVNQSGAGYITMTGTWLASAIFSDDAMDNLRIESFPGGVLHWTGGRCLNANRDGIRIVDKTTTVVLDGALRVDGCAQTGINLEPDDPDDASGDYAANVFIGSGVTFNANNTNVNPEFRGPTKVKYGIFPLDASGALSIDHGLPYMPFALVAASAFQKGGSGEAVPIAVTVDGTQMHVTGGTANGSVRISLTYLSRGLEWSS